MSRWKNIRTWANKNNGSFYQVENQNLTIYEVIGYLLIIASFIIYILNEKTGFNETWIGWLLLIIGAISAILGGVKRTKNDKNT